MNQERSRRGKSDPLQAKCDLARQKSPHPRTGSIKVSDANRSSNTSQITPLHQPLWFWSKHSSWSYFKRGFFWGGIISLTAVFSAMGGVALSKIEAIEQAIVHSIDPQYRNSELTNQATLDRPVDILLIEVQSNNDDIVEFSQAALGKSKTILLLKIQPQLDLAQAIYIPNNSSVTIPGFGLGTIQDAYQIGGAKLLSEVVNQLVVDTRVEHYVRATPQVFRQLTASGKITLEDCQLSFRDCSDRQGQVRRQQSAFNTIRQRLNIPAYLRNFQTAITNLESEIDADVSVKKIMAWANFIKELEPENIDVDLLPAYTPGKSLSPRDLVARESPLFEQQQSRRTKNSVARSNNHPFQDSPIAVQNTTKNPELGIQVVAYLRHRNFREVYLVRHSPLELDRTRIVANSSHIDTANYLKNILGFGNLKTRSNSPHRGLTLQVGEDALYLPTNYRSYQQY